MNRTYHQCVTLAEEIWGERWYMHCQIFRTTHGRTHDMWVVKARVPSLFALRRVP